MRPMVSSMQLGGCQWDAINGLGARCDVRREVQRDEIGRDVLGVEEQDDLDEAEDGDARGEAAGAEHEDDLELLLHGQPHGPRNRDRDEDNNKIGDDCQDKVGDEETPLVDAADGRNGRVPVGLDGRADHDLDRLHGRVGEEQGEDEDVDALGDALFDGEDAGDEEQDGHLDEVRGGDVDDGAGV